MRNSVKKPRYEEIDFKNLVVVCKFHKKPIISWNTTDAYLCCIDCKVSNKAMEACSQKDI